MMKFNYISLVLPLLVLVYLDGPASAQRFAPGYCPTVAAHENFDKTRFFGNWIEVEKTPSIFDLMMRCLVVDYSDDQDNTVNVVVRGISLAGLPLTVNGDGLLQDVHRSGFYSIRYGFGVPFQGTLTTIVDTDYDDYAVVYSCTNSLLSGVFHSEYIWVLSRNGKISNPTRQNIYEKLDRLQINRSGLTMSDRSTCPTNSSLIARESDKDLAGQAALGAVSPASSSSGVASGQSENSSSPNAVLEKASVEPTQKSVVVPLLYDLPSPASSSSVGGKQANKQAPPAPVENKIQLPLSGASAQSGKSEKSVSGVVKQSAPSSGVQQQQQQQQVQQQPSPVLSSQANPSGSSSVQQQQQQQGVSVSNKQASQSQGQQQSLLSKLQPKSN